MALDTNTDDYSEKLKQNLPHSAIVRIWLKYLDPNTENETITTFENIFPEQEEARVAVRGLLIKGVEGLGSYREVQELGNILLGLVTNKDMENPYIHYPKVDEIKNKILLHLNHSPA